MATSMHKKALAQSMTNGGGMRNGGIARPDGRRPHQRNDAKLYCKICKTDYPNVVEETANGDLVCGDCGLVLGDRVVDTRSEWRTFANDDGPDQSRVGNGPSHRQTLEGTEDYSTEINFRDGSTGLSKLLQRAQRNVIGAQASNRRDDGFAKIDEFCGKMNVSSVVAIDQAKQIFARVEEVRVQEGNKNKFAKGKNGADAVTGACLYLACKEHHVTRSMKEVCDILTIRKKELGFSVKAIGELMRTDSANGVKQPVVQKTTMPSQGAVDLLPRFCHQLGMDARHDGYAKDILVKAFAASPGMVDGRSPISVAAGAIWFVIQLFGLDVAMKDVATVTQVSDGTIKLITKIFARNREELIPEHWVQMGADLSRIAVPDLVKREK